MLNGRQLLPLFLRNKKENHAMQFVKGIRYCLGGFGLLLNPSLRAFVWLPLLVNTLVLGSAIYFGGDALNQYVEGFLPEWLSWLGWIIKPVIFMLLAFVGFYIFSLLANIIASPFNGLLAEKTEFLLTGETVEQGGGWAALVADIIPSILNELSKLSYFLIRYLPLLVLFVIPGLNVIVPILLFVVGAWFLTLEYTDYPMANHGVSFSEQRQRLKDRRLLCMGFGCCVAVLLLIPVVNFFVMPVAVIGASVMWVREIKNDV